MILKKVARKVGKDITAVLKCAYVSPTILRKEWEKAHLDPIKHRDPAIHDYRYICSTFFTAISTTAHLILGGLSGLLYTSITKSEFQPEFLLTTSIPLITNLTSGLYEYFRTSYLREKED